MLIDTPSAQVGYSNGTNRIKLIQHANTVSVFHHFQENTAKNNNNDNGDGNGNDDDDDDDYD